MKDRFTRKNAAPKLVSLDGASDAISTELTTLTEGMVLQISETVKLSPDPSGLANLSGLTGIEVGVAHLARQSDGLDVAQGVANFLRQGGAAGQSFGQLLVGERIWQIGG